MSVTYHTPHYMVSDTIRPLPQKGHRPQIAAGDWASFVMTYPTSGMEIGRSMSWRLSGPSNTSRGRCLKVHRSWDVATLLRRI